MKLDVSKLNNQTNLGVIICGFSGIGKTTLGKKYENVAEMGQSLYRNIYEGIDASKIDREKHKNINTGIKKNPDWPSNYINKIQELRQNHDLVLVFTDFELMDVFRKKNIPFIIAMPDKSRKDEFLYNFKLRGQDDAFCQKASEMWDIKLNQLNNMPEEKIILYSGYFLEDYF